MHRQPAYRSWWAIRAAVVVAMAGAVWQALLRQDDPSSSSTTNELKATTASVVDHSQPSVLPERDAAPERSGPTSEQALLRIVLDGGPAPGRARIAWVTGPRLGELEYQLVPEDVPGLREPPGVVSLDVAGQCEVPVPPGSWTWVRVASSDRRVLFEAVPPFEGSRELRVDLRRPPLIHVRVLDASYVRARPRAEVRVLRSEWTNARQPELALVRTVMCDGSGEANIGGIPSGRILLLTRGAQPGDREPSTAVISWRAEADSQASDVVVSLVETAPRRQVRICAHVGAGLAASPTPKLFLRRIDLIGGELIPQREVLRVGVQDVVFDAPEGTYQLEALPIGTCRLEGSCRLDVGAMGIECTVAVTPVPASTQVTLLGMGPDEPWRVAVQPVDGLRMDDPERLFFGPLHWGAGGATVPPIAELVWVQALGRSRSFVSKSPVVLSGPRVAVEMETATCLRVDWAGDLHDGSTAPMLVAKVGSLECVRPFQRDLVLAPAGKRPGLVASLVLPAGRTELQAWVGGTQVWSKDVALSGRLVCVRVGD